MRKKIKRIKNFLNNELWSINTDKLSKPARALINFLRIVSLGVRGFKEDKLSVNASALTYFTLLSIVPVMALGFGIAKGFGMEKMLKEELTSNLKGQEEVLNYILDFTGTMLDSAKGGIIAGFGFVLLIWSVIKLLSNIESIFNRVWDIKKSRTIVRKFTDYLTMMLLGPVFMVLASSFTVFISSRLSGISEDSMFGFVSPLFLQFAKIIPFIIVWIIFTILYLVMPNTRVKFRSAVIAGITAGTVFQIFQNLYVYFQASATRISAVYGSFAALPLFLIWLQTAWFVVLLGAEISYAVQNVKLKGSSLMFHKLSIKYQKKLAVYILVFIIDFFRKGNNSPTSQKLAELTALPVYTVDFILNNLKKTGVVSEVLKNGKKTYQPGTDIENITLAKVFSEYDKFGQDYSKYINSGLFKEVEKHLENLYDKLLISDANIKIKNIFFDRTEQS